MAYAETIHVTRTSVLAMTAGAEMDRLIAKKVMGCRIKRHRSKLSGRWLYDLVIPGGVNEIDFVDPEGPWGACPRYSTEIVTAWQVVNKLCTDGMWWQADGGRFNLPVKFKFSFGDEVEADTIQLAICRAALLTLCED